MLKFLRSIFSKKVNEPVVVSVPELSGWLDGQIEEKVKDLDGAVQELNSSVSRLRQQLREQRDALLAASLADEDSVEPRVKNIVLGHRTNYCRELALFLNDMSIPEQTSLTTGRGLSGSIQASLDSFAGQTVKSFSATRHLFHKEVDPIAESLRELSETTKRFEQFLHERGVFTFDQLREKARQVQRTFDQKTRLSQDLIVQQKRLENAQKQRALKEQEIAALRESADFQAYSQLMGKHDAVTKEHTDVEREISVLFIELDRALRKYQHKAPLDEQSLVKSYLENPREALLEDATLRIEAVLGHVKEQLPQLDLKEEHVNKLLGVLGNVQLRGLRERLVRLKGDKVDLSNKMHGDPTLMRLQEHEYKLAHFTEQVDRFTKEIAVTTEAIEGLTVEEPLRALEAEIKNALVPVKITLSV